MTHKIFCALLLTLLASYAAAEGGVPPVAELCKTVYCRAPHVQLRVDEQRRLEQRGESPLPVLLPNGWVTVYPGESVYLEVEVREGELKLLRAVPKPEKPETTLVLKFEQMADKTDMMLTVTNPLPVDVRFSMGFMSIDSSRIVATSSCPVYAGKALFEHWPHPIFQLFLADPQVLAAADDHSCK